MGYIEAFKSFRDIITIENTKFVNIADITTDFEISLIKKFKIKLREIFR